MINDPEKRLIEALKNVDAHGDVAPPHVHDPMTMVLRENAIQAHLMHWDDARGRYALTGAGRRRISARGRTPGTILSFRKHDVLGRGLLSGRNATSVARRRGVDRRSGSIPSTGARCYDCSLLAGEPKWRQNMASAR
jgi:hypothetical protein